MLFLKKTANTFKQYFLNATHTILFPIILIVAAIKAYYYPFQSTFIFFQLTFRKIYSIHTTTNSCVLQQQIAVNAVLILALI